MKFIKNHLMFILPLMAILLGIEFFLVFDRTTDSYEKRLKEGYTMLVVSSEPLDLARLQVLNRHIASIEAIEREAIIDQTAKGFDEVSKRDILASLPYFYNVGLDSYLETDALTHIKEDLKTDPQITRVETFGHSYSSSYRLFTLIKFLLKVFLAFMGVVSLFLIIKQMEIWKYAHRERMQVMEIFGAPLMLRSGVLFKVAIFDAIIATLLTSAIFFYVKFVWAKESRIQLLVEKQNELFQLKDVGFLLVIALCVVIISVYSVVVSSKGSDE